MKVTRDTGRGRFRQMSFSFRGLVILSTAVPIYLLLGFAQTTAGPWFSRQKLTNRILVYDYRVVNVYPHDRQAFTQGLIYCDGFLYESTGLNGRSTLRKVRLETGKVLERHTLAREYFGEGITQWGSRLLQLTWKSNVGFVYEKLHLKLQQTFRYSGEGWGLAHDQTRLIISDGTASLRFLDPQSLQEIERLTVRHGDTPLMNLNELEFVQGEIYANVWQTDLIAKISPQTGQVTGWIDLRGLLTEADKRIPVDVLNGIAYDSQRNRLFVTGKLWPKLFEITLVRRE